MILEKILEEAKVLKKEVEINMRKGAIKNKIPYNKIKEIKEDIKFLELFEEFTPVFKKEFIVDSNNGKGKNIKCVRNAFKETKYRKLLDNYEKNKEINKNNSLEDFIKYLSYGELSKDVSILEEIFDIIESSLKLIKEDLEKETFLSTELICRITMLVARLAQLYNLYGAYLTDMDLPNTYTVFYQTLVTFQRSLENLFNKMNNLVNEKGD